MTRAMLTANQAEVRDFAQGVATHATNCYMNARLLNDEMKQTTAHIHSVCQQMATMQEQMRVLINTTVNIAERLDALTVDTEEGRPTKKLRTREPDPPPTVKYPPSPPMPTSSSSSQGRVHRL